MGKATPRGTARVDGILDAAAMLFAQRGFDGVGTREVAAAVGLNIATVHHHVGRKAELYKAVMERLHASERQVLEQAVARLDAVDPADPRQVAAALRRALDDYLDFLVDEPAAAPLWLRRWIDAPTDPDQLWQRHSAPLYELLARRLRKVAKAGAIDLPDPYLLLRTIAWATHAYLVGGLPATGRLGDPREAASLRRFRRFLHQLVGRALGLSGAI
ncbi:MAG: TetR/AcrR family transcriptional regulator [Gammaproteobacteria bacterium]